MAQISGAVDLSALASTTSASNAGVYVTEVTEASFEAVVRKSIQHPVVIEFYSSKAPESTTMGEILSSMANSSGGSWLLGRMNVDTSPQVVQALQVRAVPMVVGVLGGQLVPLWQGSMPKEDAEKVIAELLKMAAGNGILGKAEPQGSTEVPGEEPEEDPRYTPAYEAMEREDYLGAKAEFDKLLAENPRDTLAKIGSAQSGLLLRVAGLDLPLSNNAEDLLAQADGENPSIEAILNAADIDVALNQVAQGFARLTTAIAESTGDDKEKLRVRLLELFDTQDPSDPEVLTARRNLATALF
ncbi:MAG: tetratricopeptide repeat protein [Propionibacteriaceae bacterium]|jgi:putative thioredoxin|nr:tetratricopeptide repeat protein [Propionibacteriaceae bacterium]